MSQIFLNPKSFSESLMMSNRIKVLLLLNLLFIFFYPTLTKAQMPSWDWAQGAGSIGNISLKKSSTTDANGNLYIAGSFATPSITFGAITLINTDTSGSKSDFFVVKYDADGNVIWARSEGGAKSDWAMGISVDLNGNVYVTGSYSSETITIGAVTLTNSDTSSNSQQDMFLIKYDNFGNVLWVKTSSNNNFWDLGFSVSTDASGNVFVTGVFQFGIVLDTVSLPSYYGWHVFTAKYNSSGNILWARTGIPNFGDADLGTSIAVDNSGNAYVTGYFNASNLHFGAFTLVKADSTSFGQDIFVVKYDASGNVLWAKSAGGIGHSGYQSSTSIATDNDNNCYVTGYFQAATIQFGNITLINDDNTGYGNDMFIAKYDASGNVLWAKRVGGAGSDDGANCVTTDAAGNVYVGGYYNSTSISFDNNILTNANNTAGSNYDSFLAKYNAFGNSQWVIGIGDSGNESVKTISISPSNDIYTTGFFSSPSIIIGADTIINSGGNGDMFIGKLNSSSVGLPKANSSDEIIIFPNPSNGIFAFKDGSNIKQVDVYNIYGEKVLQLGNTKQIDLRNFAKGIYLVSVNEAYAFKLVKE